jgi:hypothetical protein
MDFLLGLLMMVFGIIAVIRGQLNFSSEFTARGTRARLAGLVLVVALPFALFIGLIQSTADRAAGRHVLGDSLSALVPYIVLFIAAVAAVLIARSRPKVPPPVGA